MDSRNALFASAKSMDCHATASAVSRNDYKNTICKKVDSGSEAQILNNSAQDSRSFAKNAKNLSKSQAEAKLDSSNEANLNEPAKDSRICDEKPLLFKPRKEIRLKCLSTQCGAEIKGLSRKTSEAVQGEAEAGFFSKVESTKKAEPLLKVAYVAA